MASELKVDTISEKTTGSGVTVDGVLLKDSKIGGTITIPGSTGTMALTSDISAGGLILISSTNAVAATDVTFDNVFTSTYQSYKMIINNYQPSVTSDLRLIFRNGGASGADITGKHDSRYYYIAGAGGWSTGSQVANNNYVVLVDGTGNTGDYGINIELWNPQVSSGATTGFMTGSWKDGGHLQTGFSLDSREEVTGVKLTLSTGTINADVYLYGYRKS